MTPGKVDFINSNFCCTNLDYFLSFISGVFVTLSIVKACKWVCLTIGCNWIDLKKVALATHSLLGHLHPASFNVHSWQR